MKWLITFSSVFAFAACGSSSTTGTTGFTNTAAASGNGSGSGSGSGSTTSGTGTHGATTSGSTTATNGTATNATTATNGTATNATTATNGTATNATATNGTATNGTATTGTATGTAAGSTTGGSSGTSGTACTVNLTAGTDPCSANGLECSAQDGTAGTCVLPYEFAGCNATNGCATDAGYTLTCAELTATLPDGGSQSEDVCIETCTATSDCSDPTTICTGATDGFCNFNECGATAAPYSLCNAAGTNDGQCFPEPNGSETIEVCFQAGTVPTWGTCDIDDLRGESLCAANNFCVEFMGETTAYCFPLCDTGDTTGPQSCTSPATCESLGSNITWGVCGTACTSASSTCPTGSTCDTTAGSCD